MSQRKNILNIIQFFCRFVKGFLKIQEKKTAFAVFFLNSRGASTARPPFSCRSLPKFRQRRRAGRNNHPSSGFACSPHPSRTPRPRHDINSAGQKGSTLAVFDRDAVDREPGRVGRRDQLLLAVNGDRRLATATLCLLGEKIHIKAGEGDIGIKPKMLFVVGQHVIGTGRLGLNGKVGRLLRFKNQTAS